MKKKLLAVVLCLAMALSAAACGGGAGDSAEPAADETTENGASSETTADEAGSNTVVIAMGSGFSTLDPGYVYEKYPPLIMNACYENLFKFYTNDGAPEPCLADTYEFSEDGLTLTVNLKQDVTFASGNKMTSADVAFSINRCKNLQGNPAFICDTIESIETPDEYTVVFHLTQPDSAFLSKLTYCSLAVLDSQVVKENGGTDAEDAATADTAQSYLNTTSAGSGMYVMTSYIPDQEVVLEKNPNYWGEATNVDKYIIQIQPDSNTQMMTLSTGDIDVAMNMTDDTMAELEGQENVVLVNGATKTVGFVIEDQKEKLVYITDTGYLPNHEKVYLENADHYIFESNHDLGMLMKTSRPMFVKQRILSDSGHLSNEDSSMNLTSLINDHTKTILLAHISQEANDPERALDVLKNTFLKKDMPYRGLRIEAAQQFSITSILND